MSKKNRKKAIGRFAFGGGGHDSEIERMYPLAKAREFADRVIDKLDARTTTLLEACRTWDMAYCEVDPIGNREVRA